MTLVEWSVTRITRIASIEYYERRKGRIGVKNSRFLRQILALFVIFLQVPDVEIDNLRRTGHTAVFNKKKYKVFAHENKSR